MRLYDVTARAVKEVDPRIAVGGPSSAAAGWVDALLTHAAPRRAGGLRLHPHVRQPAARPAADAGSLGLPGRASAVDGVGRHTDPLQPGQRRRVLGHVPAQRHALGGREGRRAVVLGGQRPLRGARPAAAPAARRVRADHRRRHPEAALPRPAAAGRARRHELPVSASGDGAGGLVQTLGQPARGRPPHGAAVGVHVGPVQAGCASSFPASPRRIST